MSPTNISGEVVIVTGGASGIGFHVADEFLQRAARVVVIVDMRESGEEAASKLRDKHGPNTTLYFRGDVSQQHFLDTVFEQVTEQFGTIDVLVNNAGIVDEIDWKKCMQVNTLAVMEWTLKLFEHMRTDTGGKGGTIINMASILGFRKFQYVPIYSTSKFAVLGFTKCLGHDYNYNTYGVRVVALCPGYTRTDMANNTALKVWDDEPRRSDFMDHICGVVWQDVEAVSRAALQVFEAAPSGTAWLIEGGEPISEV